MTTQNQVSLSFCIPSYNRAESAFRLVSEILSCPDPDIEIVVLDNGSTDGTLSRLSAIHDVRLRVFSNGENRGALFNMVNVLEKAVGCFVVYCTDQDHVDPMEIPRFKNFLLGQEDIAAGYCLHGSPSDQPSRHYEKGVEAVLNIAYLGRHPTGYFFAGDLLRSIHLVDRFSDFNLVDLFPLEFAFAELCTQGAGAVYSGPVFRPETGKPVTEHKSSTTRGDSEFAFFAPRSRQKLAVNYSLHVATLPLTDAEKKRLVSAVYTRGLAEATLGYRAVMRNEKLRIHYNITYREVGLVDLAKIASEFEKGYKKAIGSSLDGRSLLANLPAVTRQGMWNLICQILGSVANKVFRR